MQRWSLPEQAGRRKSQKWKRESSNERRRAVEQSFVRSPLMFNVSKSPRDRGNLLHFHNPETAKASICGVRISGFLLDQIMLYVPTGTAY